MALIKKGTGDFLETYGTLQVDKYGLSTATARFIRANNGTSPSLPSIGDTHPIWTQLQCEKINVTHVQTWFEVETGYAGIIGAPAAVYELDQSTADEPIETHPDFADFAGDAAAPLNEAVFDSDGVFVNFKSGTFAGIRSYLAPGAVWRETIVSLTNPSGLGTVGAIETPAGSPPSISGSYNWLYTGMSYEKRGGCYTIKREWRLSGRRGWNATIYG